MEDDEFLENYEKYVQSRANAKLSDEDIDILTDYVENLGMKTKAALDRLDIILQPKDVGKLLVEGFRFNEMIGRRNFTLKLTEEPKEPMAPVIKKRIEELYGNDITEIFAAAYQYVDRRAKWDNGREVHKNTELPLSYFIIFKGIGMHKCETLDDMKIFELSDEDERIRRTIGVPSKGRG